MNLEHRVCFKGKGYFVIAVCNLKKMRNEKYPTEHCNRFHWIDAHDYKQMEKHVRPSLKIHQE